MTGLIFQAATPAEGAIKHFLSADNAQHPAFTAIVQHQALPDPDTPRKALQDQTVARLFQSYISDISKWYDLSDAASSFGIVVPTIALDEPLLFCAVIALSAMHTCKTSAPSFRKIAEFYHYRCLQLLIKLTEGDDLIVRGVALAATCLLRSYEILDGDVDPNMHLRGAYSMASLHDILSGTLQAGLLGAGFWNYLREDITFSLFEECPLKMNLESTPLIIQHDSDQGFLNSITLILGKIINMAFGRDPNHVRLDSLVEMLEAWRGTCPDYMKPFSRLDGRTGSSHHFPATWFLQPSHAAILHYYLVALTIISVHTSPNGIDGLDYLDHIEIEGESTKNILETLALEICGIAFTAKIPSVLVNAFGPIAYCARFIQAEGLQQELIRQLQACKLTIGWPVERLISDLKASWEMDQN
ncbi:hypothetical protein FHETE_1893 [Fusarium heterosporum]|uniref:Uncharacterized protein n=1 Tax=Fusarium heterosporum TaxID=42747 RepID=A0A8H5TTK1_FUSHE|nr:hypothetical protein FHETE_1893 [Fusarium heterosporum]